MQGAPYPTLPAREGASMGPVQLLCLGLPRGSCSPHQADPSGPWFNFTFPQGLSRLFCVYLSFLRCLRLTVKGPEPICGGRGAAGRRGNPKVTGEALAKSWKQEAGQRSSGGGRGPGLTLRSLGSGETYGDGGGREGERERWMKG